MIKVTLDHNAIVDLEQNNKYATYYRKLVELHINGKIHLRISAIHASEKKPNGTYVTNFAEFKRRIDAIGLSSVEILAPLCYAGISFAGYCLVGGGNLSKLEEEIQTILFPNIEMEYTQYEKKQGLGQKNTKTMEKWMNAKCDVLSLWSHIYYKGDIFVTKDNHFHKKTKKPLLIQLGAVDILEPNKVITKLRYLGIKT